MKSAGRLASPLLLAALGLLWGCNETPRGWTPVMEETSTTFLEEETGRVLEHVQEALQRVGDDPGGIAPELERAESRLEHLLDYYLPLVQARERAYNAYRMFYLGDEAGVSRELAAVEDILASMAEKADGQRLTEIESLAETVASTRMATASGTDQGQKALEALARLLNQAAVKGDLVLRR